MKINILYLIFLLAFSKNISTAQTLTRGPYLQMGSQTAISIRWRTDVPTNTKVRFGTVQSVLNQSISDNNATTEHEIRVTNLTADTKYFYEIGSTTTPLQGNAENYFVTMPPLSTKRKIRVVGFGDSGNNSQNQRDVRDAFINFRGTNPTDVMLLMGDNAYDYGYEAEYQTKFFDIYQTNLLKNCKLYPVIGNHDYNNSDNYNALRGDPVHYYECFTLPKNAECGGTPSGTEAFYSVDYGGIHFVMLDSYGTENGKKLYDSTGLQAQWLKADLTATTQKWTIAVMHHPPYTKGSHDSDAEGDLVMMREQINPILERFGVDLAIYGHSHVFERSFLIKNHYGMEPTFSPILHQITASSGKYDGSANSCPINLTTQKTKHGTVYVVSGSSGQVGGASNGWTHDAMIYSENQIGGVFYFEVEDNRLDAFFLKSNGAIGDNFTLMKDVSTKKTLNVLANQPTTLTASYIGNYNWSNGTSGTRSITVSQPLGTYFYYVNDNQNCLKDTFILNVLGTIPVELTDFRVKIAAQNTVLIEWQTASERHNNHFLIERSTDGIHFEIIEKRAGGPLSIWSATTSRESGKPFFYSFLDKNPSNGVNYYRLSQVDDDGTTTVFGVRSVNFLDKKTGVQVVPNPSKDGHIQFQIHNFEQKTGKIVVSNTLGQVVFDAPISTNPISTHLPTGVYIVQFFAGALISATQKFVVD
jgi:predicted phosphodiesterase